MSAPGRQRLGYVLKRFPRISETFVAAELIELERQGEEVTVFALSKPDEPFTHGFLRELSAPVVYLPHRPLREPARVAAALVHVLRRSPRGWLAAAAHAVWPPRLVGVRRLLQATVLRRELEEARIVHAHAHFATAAAGLAHLAWRMGGPSYSVTAHAKDIYHRDVRVDRLREKLEPASFVATVSSANRDYLGSVLPGARAIHVVPNSVDLRRLAPPSASARAAGPVVLSVARLVEKKGLEDLVAAAPLLGRGHGASVEIAGDGPLRPQLEAQARAAAAPVVFHGVLPHERVLALYERAAAFCLPCVVASTGDRDGLPTSVLEAMARGVPVVTTAVNGLAEVVHDGRTGLVVPEHDPEAIAAAVGRLLADPELAARVTAGARALVEERFSLERSVTLLRTLFAEAA